jgi:hypothetical protein
MSASPFLGIPSIAWRPDRGKAARQPRLPHRLSSWSMGEATVGAAMGRLAIRIGTSTALALSAASPNAAADAPPNALEGAAPCTARDFRTCQAPWRTSRTAASRRRRFAVPRDCEQFSNLLNVFSNLLGNGVTVAQQTLTLFVLVRIQVPQPTERIFPIPSHPLSLACGRVTSEGREIALRGDGRTQWRKNDFRSRKVCLP